MTKPPRYEPRPEAVKPSDDVKWWEPILMAAVIVLAGYGLVVFISPLAKNAYLLAKPYFVAKPPELSPGELVDLAMAMPGAVVLTPHRDLASMGLAESSGTFLGSPSIGVHTPKKWCIWELGDDFLVKSAHFSMAKGGELIQSNGNEFIASNYGYEAAYKVFTQCVADRNKAYPPTTVGNSDKAYEECENSGCEEQ